jgi:hypothetical protein
VVSTVLARSALRDLSRTGRRPERVPGLQHDVDRDRHSPQEGVMTDLLRTPDHCVWRPSSIPDRYELAAKAMRRTNEYLPTRAELEAEGATPLNASEVQQ